MLLASVLEGWAYETNVEEGWQLPVTWIALKYSGVRTAWGRLGAWKQYILKTRRLSVEQNRHLCV